MDVVELSVSLIIIGIVAKYLTYVLGFLGIVLPSVLYKFIFLAFAISIVQYIISRKDD